MKRFLLIIFPVVLLSSCAGLRIEKRKYTGGFSVQWKDKMVAQEESENLADEKEVEETVSSEWNSDQFNCYKYKEESVNEVVNLASFVKEAKNDFVLEEDYIGITLINKVKKSDVDVIELYKEVSMSEPSKMNKHNESELYYKNKSDYYAKIMVIALVGGMYIGYVLVKRFFIVGVVFSCIAAMVFLVAYLLRYINRARYRAKVLERLTDSPEDQALKKEMRKQRRRRRLLLGLFIVYSLLFTLIAIAFSSF